jgi:hypothetical protein
VFFRFNKHGQAQCFNLQGGCLQEDGMHRVLQIADADCRFDIDNTGFPLTLIYKKTHVMINICACSRLNEAEAIKSNYCFSIDVNFHLQYLKK